MNIPTNLLYTKSHEWVAFSNDTTAKIGLTDYAQHALGDLVFVNLPEAEDAVAKETSFADVESVKAVSDVYCPVTGTITAINEDVLEAPEKINAAPYETWLIEVSSITEKTEFLNPAAYEALCKEEA